MNLTLKVKVKSKTRKRRRVRKSKLKKNSKKGAYHKALSVNNLGDIQSSDQLQKSFEMEKGEKAVRADKTPYKKNFGISHFLKDLIVVEQIQSLKKNFLIKIYDL